jgi:hypothetical protein
VEHTKLFELLIHLAKNGINNLIRTYNQTDKTHVLHTLQMYKNMLDGTNNSYNYHTAAATPVSVSIIPELNHIVPPLLSQQQQQSSMNHEHSPYDKNNNKHNNKHGYHDKKNKITRVENDNVTASSISLESESERQLNKKELNSFPMSSPASPASPEIDMDTIFIKISELYTDEIFRIIYNVFIEMSRDDTNFVDYANGLNMMLHPINIRIKKWIDENIVF